MAPRRATRCAVNNLAGTLAAPGDGEAARATLEETIAMLIRVFGADDPDTLAAMGNLAALMWQQGEREDAFGLAEHVAERLGRTRDADDPAARNAKAVRDAMLGDSGV
jgi:hypothetical protein